MLLFFNFVLTTELQFDRFFYITPRSCCPSNKKTEYADILDKWYLLNSLILASYYIEDHLQGNERLKASKQNLESFVVTDGMVRERLIGYFRQYLENFKGYGKETKKISDAFIRCLESFDDNNEAKMRSRSVPPISEEEATDKIRKDTSDNTYEICLTHYIVKIIHEHFAENKIALNIWRRIVSQMYRDFLQLVIKNRNNAYAKNYFYMDYKVPVECIVSSKLTLDLLEILEKVSTPKPDGNNYNNIFIMLDLSTFIVSYFVKHTAAINKDPSFFADPHLLLEDILSYLETDVKFLATLKKCMLTNNVFVSWAWSPITSFTIRALLMFTDIDDHMFIQCIRAGCAPILICTRYLEYIFRIYSLTIEYHGDFQIIPSPYYQKANIEFDNKGTFIEPLFCEVTFGLKLIVRLVFNGIESFDEIINSIENEIKSWKFFVKDGHFNTKIKNLHKAFKFETRTSVATHSQRTSNSRQRKSKVSGRSPQLEQKYIGTPLRKENASQGETSSKKINSERNVGDTLQSSRLEQQNTQEADGTQINGNGRRTRQRKNKDGTKLKDEEEVTEHEEEAVDTQEGSTSEIGISNFFTFFARDSRKYDVYESHDASFGSVKHSKFSQGGRSRPVYQTPSSSVPKNRTAAEQNSRGNEKERSEVRHVMQLDKKKILDEERDAMNNAREHEQTGLGKLESGSINHLSAASSQTQALDKKHMSVTRANNFPIPKDYRQTKNGSGESKCVEDIALSETFKIVKEDLQKTDEEDAMQTSTCNALKLDNRENNVAKPENRITDNKSVLKTICDNLNNLQSSERVYSLF